MLIGDAEFDPRNASNSEILFQCSQKDESGFSLPHPGCKEKSIEHISYVCQPPFLAKLVE